MVRLSDLHLMQVMQVEGSPLGVFGEKIMAELQSARRFGMLEGCGKMPLHPSSVAETFLFCGSRSCVGERCRHHSRKQVIQYSGGA
jgi:hypothetical protein